MIPELETNQEPGTRNKEPGTRNKEPGTVRFLRRRLTGGAEFFQ
jgi:hypothetical protein